MDVAIRGDRASCLTMQLGPRTWLLAVARGFGTVHGVATERALLAALRAECERRLRGERFRRAVDRPPAAATAVLAALARVNGELFARSPGHDDYVTAASSFTAALVVRGSAYIVHSGGTAAYLAHHGEVAALTGDDSFDDSGLPVLARALGTTAALDVSVSSVTLDEGDVLVLLGHRVPGDVDRRALIAHVESADPVDHVLVARFEHDDASAEEPAPLPRSGRVATWVRVGAAILLAIALAFAR